MVNSQAARWLSLISVALLLALVPATVRAGEKNDLVVLAKGARLMVEIKSMYLGRLKAKTDEMGTVYIEWDDITAVSSQTIFDVMVESGEKFVGTLEEGPEAGRLVVRGEGAQVTLVMARVVLIYPLDTSFWRRIKGSLDLGYGLKSEDNVSHLNLGLDAQYNTHRWRRRLSADGNYSGRDLSDTTKQSQAWFETTHFLLKHPKWGIAGLVLAQQNTGLGLDRRLMGGAMLGRILAASNRNVFIIFAGADYSNEKYTGERALSEEGFDSSYQSEDQTVEGMLLLVYEGFRYDSPKYNLGLRLLVLPGVTDSDSLRLNFQGSVSYEIFHNFTAGVSASYAYDSLPPVTGVENYTYILGATIGYLFN